MATPRPISEADLPESPVALVIAHPGHEMRVHAWLARARPEVFVLTDGSGHGEHGRIDSTAAVLEGAGATRGSIFGQLTDRQAYRLILDHRFNEVRSLIVELTERLTATRVRSVVSDAVEGMNPVHDLCLLIARAAVAQTARRLGRPVGHYDFLLDAAPDARAGADPGALCLRLSEDELRHKVEVARAYEALRSEVDRALELWGEEAFRLEVLHPVDSHWSLEEQVGKSPAYEEHGRRRVTEGVYDDVLQFREHFLPLATSIREWVESS